MKKDKTIANGIQIIGKKYKILVSNTKSYQKEVNQKMKRLSYTNPNSFKALKKHFSQPNILDSISRSIEKEIQAINQMLKKNERDIEWELNK